MKAMTLVMLDKLMYYIYIYIYIYIFYIYINSLKSFFGFFLSLSCVLTKEAYLISVQSLSRV